MPEQEWQIPPDFQPDPGHCAFELEAALSSVVALRSTVPVDAFTAGILGTERGGSGVLIRGDGLILTIGYIVTEADSIWITASDGQALQGHALAYDQETGFGLVQALGRLRVPPMELGDSRTLEAGESVIAAAAGGRRHALKAMVSARQEFAGYWEYLLDNAILTAPAHPVWGGAGLIGPEGTLMGIGSLHVQHTTGSGTREANMFVPIELLPPILDELLTYGRRNRKPRPWLGIYAAEAGNSLAVAGLADNGPAEKAGLQVGDRIIGVGDAAVPSLAALWRQVWRCGEAGASVPLKLMRDDAPLAITVRSADRAAFLKRPRLH